MKLINETEETTDIRLEGKPTAQSVARKKAEGTKGSSRMTTAIVLPIANQCGLICCNHSNWQGLLWSKRLDWRLLCDQSPLWLTCSWSAIWQERGTGEQALRRRWERRHGGAMGGTRCTLRLEGGPGTQGHKHFACQKLHSCMHQHQRDGQI